MVGGFHSSEIGVMLDHFSYEVLPVPFVTIFVDGKPLPRGDDLRPLVGEVGWEAEQTFHEPVGEVGWEAE